MEKIQDTTSCLLAPVWFCLSLSLFRLNKTGIAQAWQVSVCTTLQFNFPPAPSLLSLGRVKRKAAATVVTGARMKARSEVSSKVRLGSELAHHSIAYSVIRAPSLA